MVSICQIQTGEKQVQLNAARVVTGLPVFSSLRSLYLETGWKTLVERRKTKQVNSYVQNNQK